LTEADSFKRKQAEWKEQCELTKIDWLERQAEKKLKTATETAEAPRVQQSDDLKALFEERRRRFASLSTPETVDEDESSGTDY
jgi:hypothetical protein